MRIALGIAVASFILNGCSSRAFDEVQRALSFIMLRDQSSLVLVSNSTTMDQLQCENSNTVVVRTSFPTGSTLYCRDRSAIDSKLAKGPVCPGGVNIGDLTVSDAVRPCNDITICGVTSAAIQSIGGRADGKSENLTYSNLPWGCRAKVDFSFDPAFSRETVSTMEFYVQPPECPFCPRQNRKTCLPCTDLDPNEHIVAGQVVNLTCSGAACGPCATLGLPEVSVPHGQGKVYYKTSQGLCGAKCADQSLLRMCNNTFWEGDPSYQAAQCVDSPCGCELQTSGGTTSFAHGTTTTVYRTNEPACGVECSTQSKIIKCEDGTWKEGVTPLSAADLAPFKETSCHKKVCNCLRPGRVGIADGATNSENYSKGTVGCTETCSAFRGPVTCNAGTLSATNSAFLSYAYDTCTQQDCGCSVPTAGGNSILLANGGSKVLYRYADNSLAVPDACTDPAFQVAVSCNNRTLTPAYDSSVFKYTGCTTHDLACTFTDGNGNKTQVASGSKLWVSVNSAPACGEPCQNLQLTCENRVFKKMVSATLTPVSTTELATYKSASQCTVKNCDCTVNGNIIPFGASDPDFYTVDKVTNCDQAGCASARATLTCGAGGATSSRGDDVSKYKYKACQFIPCSCEVPWGGSIQSGKTVQVFSVETSTCSTPAVCETASNFINVSCNNAVLSDPLTGAYRYPTCTPPVCSCSLNGIKRNIGSTLTAFNVEKAPDGETCDSHAATLTCNAGGLWTGADVTQFVYTSCSDVFNDDGTGGGTGGGTGNDEGPGAAFRRRLGLADPGGGGSGPCLSVTDCRKLVVDRNVTGLPRYPCVVPWGGGEAEFYSEISAFNTKCVVSGSGDSCDAHRITRICHAPSWTGADEYKFPACKEKPSCP